MSMYPDPKSLEQRMVELEQRQAQLEADLLALATPPCPHLATKITANKRLFCTDCNRFIKVDEVKP